MDPSQLVAPDNPLGLPAPLWFLVALKVLGFTLHAAAMNVWYAGIPVALLLQRRREQTAQKLSARLMLAMPVVLALGVNFGIVPLLFTQVAYGRVFYPATILMAWPWFSIIPLLILAYYGVYIYAAGVRAGRLTRWRKAGGWVSGILFIAIGYLFASAMSLMTNVAAWPELWRETSVAAAPLGLAHNAGDPTLLLRFLMMFGLAITTTAVFIAVDAGRFVRGPAERYRSWTARFAFGLHSLGLAWFAATGAWYVFGTWPDEIRARMLSGPSSILMALTALSPGLPWVCLMRGWRSGLSLGLVARAGAAQGIVLALNAVSRQVVQNLELRPYLDVAAQPVATQWGPLVVFLILLAGGTGLVVWMARRAVAAAGADARDPQP